VLSDHHVCNFQVDVSLGRRMAKTNDKLLDSDLVQVRQEVDNGGKGMRSKRYPRGPERCEKQQFHDERVSD
jgi:hypothetical protein